MTIIYLSPSCMPSRQANSIHVAQMCSAFNRLGHEVSLFIRRSVQNDKGLKNRIENYYGVDLSRTKIISHFYSPGFGDNLLTALNSLTRLNRIDDGIIISRNLYASAGLSLYCRFPIVHEIHDLEYGFRKWLQRLVFTSKHGKILAISNSLLKALTLHHGHTPRNAIVLHDAAPDGIKILSDNEKNSIITSIQTSQSVSSYPYRVGYFGHLYNGRGVSLISELAMRHSNCSFLLFGGNDRDIERLRSTNRSANLHVMGYVQPSKVYGFMSAMDILLMPYQLEVSVSRKGHNTAEWMSPMKMFEYMAVGVPLVSSDFPVLREVLRDGYNCILAAPDKVEEWSSAVTKLLSNKRNADRIGQQARADYLKYHTWSIRAQAILDFVQQ